VALAPTAAKVSSTATHLTSTKAETNDRDRAITREIDSDWLRRNQLDYANFVRLWDLAEQALGATTASIESGRDIRRANSKVPFKASKVQSKAQYGRLLPIATNVSLHVLKLLFQWVSDVALSTCLTSYKSLEASSKCSSLVWQ